MNRVKLNIAGLTYSHSQTEAYALILAEEGGNNRRLPIIIAKNEAQSIAIYLENKESRRPLTHDLLKTITEILDGDIIEVCIIKLLSGVFYAEISLIKDTHLFKIDSRVSDAVALALHFDVPIYCRNEVMEAASFILEEHYETNEEEDQNPSTNIDTFSEYTIKQLNMMMNEAVRDEDYERAAYIKNEIKKRNEI